MDSSKNTLKRSLTLPLITLYGLGTTLGPGTYALLGPVAGDARHFAPVSLVIPPTLAPLSPLPPPPALLFPTPFRHRGTLHRFLFWPTV